MANLLLTFPGDEGRMISCRGSIRSKAEQKGVSRDELAEETAETWERRALSPGTRIGQRIARLRQSADFSLFTPGSSSGRPGFGPGQSGCA